MTNNKNIPDHIGLILDGNRRWAKAKGLPTLAGHKRGFDKIDLVKGFFSQGVDFLSLYAFSTENWKRSEKEVSYLMELLRKAIVKEIKKAEESDIRIMISGRIKELPGDIPDKCYELIDITKDKKGGTLNLCINYGGRSEIVDSVRSLMEDGASSDEITEKSITSRLYNNELPDLDLIIRTSGEKRLSGFQLWRSAYSEFLFLDKNWPDFSSKDIDFILKSYADRHRRFGGD